MKCTVAVFLVLALLATGAVAFVSQGVGDPLAPYRAGDGSLHIPGGALTPELQRLIFGGDNLQPYVNLSYYAPARSPYATAALVERGYLAPNPNVFIHPGRQLETIVAGIAHLIADWFPPVDWGAQLRAAAGWLFGLLAGDARAAVTVDTTTVTDVTAVANTCTTTQTAGATDNAVLVLLSERGTTAFLTVTYGSVSLSLLGNTAANGGTFVRTEIWGFAGTLPAGSQTMTATLSGGLTARMTCATALLRGVRLTGPFINGTSANANGANASVTLPAAVTSQNLAFAVAALQNGGASVQPTAVTGTGATATDLYGVGTGHCTGNGSSNECAAGADLPNPGTAITWTNPATVWVVSAIEVVATPTCGTIGGGNCYRIGVGGTWTTPSNWSNSPGGASCGCTPLPTDVAVFDAAPTGTVTLAGTTTIAGLDMTGFTGTLSTTASNYALTVNGDLTIQGTFSANGSTITVRSMDSSGGAFTAGTSTIVVSASGGSINVPQTVRNLTVSSGISTTFTGNLTFSGTLTLTSSTPTFDGSLVSSGAAAVAFGSATLAVAGSWDTSSASSLTSTSSTVTFSGAAKTVRLAAGQSFATLSVSGTLTQLSQLTATGLTVSGGSLTKGTNPLTVTGNLTLSGGALISTSGAVAVAGNVTVSAAASYIQAGSESWTVSGSWTNASTSASWSAGTGTMTFNAASAQTMVFAGTNLAVAEFRNVVFDTSAAAGVTYTMSTRGLILSGDLTIRNTAPSPTGNTVLTTSASNLPITITGAITTASTGTLTANGSTLTFQSFNTSAGTFNVGASTLIAGTTGGTLSAPQALNNLAVTTGVTVSAGSNLTINGTLTVNGVLASLTYGLTVATLTTLSGGITAGASGTKALNGNVTVNAAGYFSFGGAPWTFAGTWTNNSTSASWSAGTGTVVFSSATGGTMDFAGPNLSGNEFSTAVFASTGATAQTFTMASRALNAAAVQVNDTSSTTTLDTSAANLPVNAGTLTVGAGGVLTARGSLITVTSMDTSAGTFTSGTSTVVVAASSGTVRIPQTLYSLTVSSGVTTAFTSNVTWSGTLTLTSSSPTFGGTLTSSGAATATFGSATISLAGSWDTSSAAGLTSTSSSVAFTGASQTVRLAAGQAFAALTVTGTLSQLSQLTAGSLTLASGSLTKGTNPLTVTGNLTLSGGALLSTSGNASISGNVNISSAASYIAFGSEAWTVSGSWTNASTSASWSPGTGMVTFNAGSPQTMTFAGTNLPGNEFNAVTFNSGATAVTFTLSTRGLSAGTITVQGGTAVTTLATANLPLTATALTVGSNGALVAGSSIIAVRSIDSSAGSFSAGTSTIVVNTSAGTVNVTQTVYNLTVNPGISTTVSSSLAFSGTLTLTSATVTFGSDLTSAGASAVLAFGSATLSVAGSWNTASVSPANFTPAGSSVTFSGAAKSIQLSPGTSFEGVRVTGTLSLASSFAATSLTLASGGLAKGTNPLTVNGDLTLSGGYLTSASGTVSVGGNVNISSAASYIAFGSETWTVSGSWTNASTSASWWAGSATVTFDSGASQTMTFAGANLPSSEFANVTFDSGSSAATFTLSTRGLTVAGFLTVGGGLATTTLDTGASSLPISAATLDVVAGGVLNANGSAITVTSIDTRLGTLAVSSCTIVVGTSGGTIDIPQTVNNLTVNPGVSTMFGGPLTWSGTLALTGATVDLGANDLTSSGAATITFASATITMSTGSWDTASATSFTSTGSSVVFSGTGSLNPGASSAFADLTISGGTRTLLGVLAANGLLTISGGTLLQGSNALIANGGLTLSGGALTSTSGTVTVGGDVSIAVSSYITFGSGAWTVDGSWTNNSTSANWAVGTATVTFNSVSSQTMTFAALPGGAAEFYDVAFDSGAATATFTMATNALVWSDALTVQGGSGTTTLATGGFGLVGGSLTIGDAGVLAADAAPVNVSTVTMLGGTSGTITITTGSWTVRGDWDTSGTGSALSAGTSSIVFTGTAASIHTASGQIFHDLTIGGTVSLASPLTAAGTLAVDAGARLTKTGQSITFNNLVENGTGSIADGTVIVTDFSVANSDAANLTTISVFSIWAADAEFAWTHASTIGTSTLTFTIGGNSLGARFNVAKDGSAYTSGLVDGSGQVVFTMLGTDPAVDVIVAAPCGGTRYWTGGAGNWSQSAHWSSTSGGAGGCSVPNNSMNVILDANSGAGTIALNQNATMASLNTTGFPGTLALGAYNFAVSGNIVHAGGTILIGASSGTGLEVSGNLILTGSAILDGSGAASIVHVSGDMAITSNGAYLRMGSGTWIFEGAWSNSSTSANWSAGTGTVVFDSAASQTLIFGNLGTSEFFNVTFASTANSGAVVFTMATNALRWSGMLMIQDGAGSTTALATADLSLLGGSLTVGNSGILTANASTVAVVDVAMNAGISGTITITSGAWTASGDWDTSGAGSAFTKGTGTVTLSGAGKTVSTLDPGHGFYNLTITGTVTAATGLDVSHALNITGRLTTAGQSVTGGADLTVSGGGVLLATTSFIAVASVTMNDGAANTISLTTGSISDSGSWDTSGGNSVFTAGTSTVILSGASGTIALAGGQAFANLLLAGTCTLASPLIASSLSIPSGGLVKGTFPLTVNGDLVLSGGYLSSVSGNVIISGNVDISSAASYIAFGSEAWTISGSWTNLSTSASWSAGTATVTFSSSSAQTMTFAGTSLAGNEFNAVTFDGGSSTVTFTLAGPGLVADRIAVQGNGGTTTLSTSGSNVALRADSLTVGSGGRLEANGSTITIRSMDTSAGSLAAGTSTVVVNASGGSVNIPQILYSLIASPSVSTTFSSGIAWSGTLTLAFTTCAFLGSVTSVGPASLDVTSATLSVSGSWDTSSAGSFAVGASSVTLTGAGQTVTMGSGQRFAMLTIAGTVALASDLTATTLIVSPSATLTKTGSGITFNRLTVNGTIADDTVHVTDLAVTNSDGTALVTISVFTSWSTGSVYAWTHTSSETLQTITWTLGGNTPGHLYRVEKDGSGYSDGTVDGSGQIVFTLLGSDPDMQVLVNPPPWWRAPYFLAIPPIGLFVVFAMFVQRRRWRPAKAFLVDERGQLLREFTLDPSCAVTYEQTRTAGALDAVDQDVRVSKYHARAVRGDTLSLIVLAVGPANVEEVELARGILVNIQDKFEDRVKQRLEEARAEESNLLDASQRAEEERADLQKRARVFGDMVNAFTIARGKMDVESRALRKQATGLAAQERTLAEDRASLDDQAKQLEALRASLDKTSTQLEKQRKKIDATEETLASREADLAPREQDLVTREAALAATEKELKGREETLSAADAKLVADLEGYHAKAQDLQRLEEDLTEERKSLDELSTQLDERQGTLDARATEVESREKEAAASKEAFHAKLAVLESRENTLAQRESELMPRETTMEAKTKAVAEEEARLTTLAAELQAREANLADQAGKLADERKALDLLRAESEEERRGLEAKETSLREREAELATGLHGLEDLKANLEPREATLLENEADLRAREKALADEREVFQGQQDMVGAKAFEIQQQMEALQQREDGLAQEKIILQDAKGALESQQRELESKIAAVDAEVKRREAELADKERTMGEAGMRLTKDREDFNTVVAEKNQWIASKEIELEAKEQSLADRETEIRAQAEENARHLSELAGREETLEIESARFDKARAEFESRKAEVGAMARDVEARAANLRDEEARKAEELRTWQTTLESEQALLKEQRDTFEKDMQDLRESWAGRMIRVEQREEDLKDREAKVQADVEWVARNESEIGKREKTTAETLKTANDLKAEAERLRAEVEQRALEIESRERDLREEAASQSIELEKRTESLQASEAELAGRKAQWERELATQTQKLREREAELTEKKESLDARGADLAAQAATLADGQDVLRKDDERLSRERVDLQMTQQRLEAGQLELAQAREKLDGEMLRFRTEADAERQSLAAKDADLRSERERLERESAALQDKLGSKAKELATREKGIAAHEGELRSEEHDLETRVREVESRERQAESRLAELTAREAAFAQSEQDLKSRRATFDQSVQKFEAETATRQREWKELQATLKSQEQQLAASAESRQAEIRKRMEDLEQREHSLSALQTQAQIERNRLEAQAKAQAGKQAETEAAAARADSRFAQLKTMEAEFLKTQQAFESEKAGWAARRSEELKQLEATRDAAAEQTQQAERLIEESQRRMYVAADAEKASKRQVEELTAAQAELERRRQDAERAEKDLERQMAQLRDASAQLAAKEVALGSRAKELDVLQARLAATEKKSAETAEDLKGRKAGLDHEAERIATLAMQLDKRQADDETRRAALEARFADLAKREQVLTTELQRADNLMEDLNRKGAEIATNERAIASKEGDLASREAALARRDAELTEGMQTFERMRKEHEQRSREVDDHHRVATQTRKEAEKIAADAQKMKAQAEAMQAEVSKNMRFLQKKALDVLDREEKIRARENRTEEDGRVLDARAQVLEKKERALEAERDDLAASLGKAKQENEKLKAKLAEAEKTGKSTIDMDEWKRDIENRVKIIQKKALDLLDREEKLRRKEEELKALAAQLGVETTR